MATPQGVAVTTHARTAKEELAALRADLKRHALVLGGFLAVLWAIAIVDGVLGHPLVAWGVHPRTVPGLVGVLTHPLLHGGFAHLLGNTVGFLMLGTMVMLREEKHFYVVTALAWIVGGLGIWLVGATDSVHVGASGLLFGYFGYLLLAGWFERRFGTILLSVIVLFVWGGMIFGVMPGQLGISWEGHLFGFLGGVLGAKLLARRPDEA